MNYRAITLVIWSVIMVSHAQDLPGAGKPVSLEECIRMFEDGRLLPILTKEEFLGMFKENEVIYLNDRKGYYPSLRPDWECDNFSVVLKHLEYGVTPIEGEEGKSDPMGQRIRYTWYLFAEFSREDKKCNRIFLKFEQS